MRNDIALLRVIAILAIVLHHSAGAFVDWPYNIVRITELDPVTFHIWRICKMIGLGLFTFISGALLNMQINRIESMRSFIIKKARRIIVPCLVAGLAYELLFPTLYAPVGPLPVIYHTHLWYLPFIFVSLVVTAILKPTWSWIGLCKIIAVIAVAHVLQPYGWLYQMNIFYPIFIAGYFHKRLINSIITSWGGYFALIIVYLANCINFPIPYIWAVWVILFDILLSVMAMNLAIKIARPQNVFWHTVEKQSFHIYLVHQFIINAILLTFTFTGIAIKWVLPMFIVTFILSLGLSCLWTTIHDKIKTVFLRINISKYF